MGRMARAVDMSEVVAESLPDLRSSSMRCTYSHIRDRSRVLTAAL